VIRLDGLNFDQAVDYHYGHFPPGEFDYAKLIDPLARAIAAVSRFDQMLEAMENEEIVLAPLRAQEAVISSRMDGNISTVDEILTFGADFESGVESSIRTKKGAAETYFYLRALASAQASISEGQSLSKFLLKALHLISFKKGSHAKPGKFKNEQNYLTDHTNKNVLFVPISPEKLEEGLHSLFTYIENEKEQTLLKVAVAYLEYEALRPFEAGNGRVGRMLVALMLWSFGVVSTPHFYVSRYIEKYRNTYFQAKQDVSAERDWTGWCEFFLQALESQAVHHMFLCKEICALYRQMETEFTQTLSSKWSKHALDYIFTRPVFRNSQFTHQANIPRSSAARFTRKLVDTKILRTVEKPSGRRAGLYSFEPLVQLIRV
jgi:Fic family protein